MRIFLIPLSTRRTFLYAQRLPSTAVSSSQAADASYVDRVAGWAARKWSEWEKKESGWQKKVVEYGNHAFRRIPHEEWGLKSVPPLRRPKGEDGAHGGSSSSSSSSATAKVELVFPPSVLRQADLVPVLSRLGTEREGLHRKKLVWCFVGMPVTAPFALVPIIPNLPFFYLVYRAWSHWRAIAGGKHIQWLVAQNLLRPKPSAVLDALYVSHEKPKLTQSQVRSLAKQLDVPALEIELERAIWQVEQEQAQEQVQEQEQQKGREKEKQP
ncbi:hypothetical protein AAL_01461 [Moelleriella libera RCEF 2490]|uniref:Mitochondrial K+-H+ exchange-related-domain-containing protein n=1 Tax=Moelleriella libera RCEF 2490 TaxID=1081109 RepID=A0A166U6R6_9HYPO|nr:hypothetical protein AAL_01461 [Moelleriella libera RCEF 2490]